jgi:predicted phage terminase large subunit-like protein
MILTPEEIQACRQSLLVYTYKSFEARYKQEMKKAAHHAIVCNALEKVLTGEIKRLIINIPVRSGKTEIAIKSFVPWSFGICKDSQYILTSYSHELSVSNSAEIRNILSSDFHTQVFGPMIFDRDQNQKHKYKNNFGGGVYSVGSGGAITGFGAGRMRNEFGGCILIDDPIKPIESFSKKVREGVNSWFTNTLESRKNTPDTPIILIMQRLHDEDLSGFLLDGGNGEKWHHVCVPAIKENGESYWPNHIPIEELERLKSSDSYTFAGQYMQQPRILGGNVIKTDRFKYFKVEPVFKYRVIIGDTAQKTKEHNDYSVFQCWGITADNCIYKTDQIRGKWEAPELEVQAVAFVTKHKLSTNGTLRGLHIEDKSSGTGLIQSVQRKSSVAVVPIKRSTDKLTRLMDVLPYIESGRVYLREDAEYLSDYLSECASFSADMRHKFDDQVDPTIDAIDILLIKSNNDGAVWLQLKDRFNGRQK